MTGLVYAVIVGVWAAVLVPMWLRRHDEAHGSRSAHRHSQAMQSLARATRRSRQEEPATDQHEWAEPSYEVPPEVNVGLLDTVRATAGAFSSRAERSGGAGLAARRRRVALLLTVLAAGSTAAVVAGVLPRAAAAGSVLLLLAYLGLVGLHARSARAAELVALREDRAEESSRIRAATAAARQRARSGRDPGSNAVRVLRDGDQWEARPTTLPTYVAKPRASKVPRVLDLTAPGNRWDGVAMVQQAQALSEAQRAAEAELQAQFAREMAELEPQTQDIIEELANPVELQPRYYRRAANE